VLPKRLLQFGRPDIASLVKDQPQQIDIRPVPVDGRPLPQALD